MKSPPLLSLLGAACAFAAGLFNACAQPGFADVIFENGDVYTMNPKREWARVVAVRDKKIIYVGNNGGVTALKGPNTKVIDLNGRMLMPGFVEGHIHPVMGAAVTRGADLQYSSHDELISQLLAYAARPDRGVIEGLVRGMGWKYSVFPSTGPTKQELDAIWHGDPVMFTAVDGHSAWLNSVALDLIPDKSDAGFVKNPPNTGEPTGYVIEGKAMEQALIALGGFTTKFITESLEAWLPNAAKAGITSVYDAGFAVLDDESGFQIYIDLEQRGLLPFRVVGSVFDNRPDFDPLPALQKLREEVNTELVQARVLKIVMDGTDANGTAAMLQPYITGTSRGETKFTPERTRELITEVDAAGFDVHVHCIGDRAVRQTLDGIEAAIKANPRRDRRHTIAHNQLTDPIDIPRFGRLGVIGQFSGQWHCRDGGYWENVTLKQWGLERGKREYRIRDFLRRGATVTLGTDWPAGCNSLVFQPLRAIQIVITRRDSDHPDALTLPALNNRLTLSQALRANTIDAAYQIRLEDKIGSIEVGKFADLIVLDHNLFKIDREDIAKVKVDMTMMNGRFTHGGF